MKLYFIDYHHKNSSGLSTYVSNLICSLKTINKINLNIIGVNAKIDSKVEKVNIDSIVHYLYSGELSVNSETNKDLIAVLKQNITQEDKVVFHFNWINHAPFAQLLKRHFDCFTVLTKHCIPWRDNITNNYKLFTNLNTIFLSNKGSFFFHASLHREFIAYSSIDHIITVTDFASHALHSMFNISKDKLTRVYNGLDIRGKSNRKKTKSELKRFYGFNESEKIILFAGNVNKRKGIFDLIEAFKIVIKKIPTARLVIAGGGISDAIFVGSKRCFSRITILGNLDKATLQDFYHLADVGVVPSYIEQCSYSAIEMMHAKLPLVVSDVDGLKEIVPLDGGLKVPVQLKKDEAKLNINKLADCFLSLLLDNELGSKLATKSYDFARKFFLSERMLEDTLNVYNKVISPRNFYNTNLLDTDTSKYISVIICLDGLADDYLKVVQSLFKQSYSCLEIKILISNEVFQKSKPIFDSLLSNKDIQFYTFSDESKKYKDLNTLLSSIQTEYLAVIDKKCEFDRDRLRKQIEFLEFKKNKHIDFVGSHCFLLDSNSNKIGLRQFPLTEVEGNILNLFQPSYEITTVLFRTTCFNKITLNFLINEIDQIELWFHILKNHAGYNINEFLTSVYQIMSRDKSHVEIIKESTANYIVEELESLGLDFDSKELSLHLAIYLNYKKAFFNSKAKMERLEIWMDKILFTKNENYSVQIVKRIKNHVRVHCCEV